MEYIDIKLKQYSKEDLEKVARIIKEGGSIIVPTDTVYGIATSALDENAVKKIYNLKQRRLSKPINILVSNFEMIKDVAKNISFEEERIIKKFFPGALTVIFEKNDKIPEIVTAGLSTVGIRMPKNKFLLDLIELLETPLATTSCNMADEPCLNNINEIIDEFKDKVDAIVDSGNIENGIPSTIIRIKDKKIEVLREGPINREELERSIG